MTWSEQDAAKFALLIAGAAESYRQEISDAGMYGYELALNDIPVSTIEIVVVRAMRSQRFMPSAAEIRELCDVPGEMTPEDRAVAAWGVVEQNAYRGPYRHVDFDDGLINATIRNLGGWVSLLDKTAEEFDKWARQDFIRVYKTFMRTGASEEACRALPGLSEVGEHPVCGTDGKVRTVRLDGPTVIETGLPALPESKVPRIGQIGRIANDVGLVLKKPTNLSETKD